MRASDLEIEIEVGIAIAIAIVIGVETGNSWVLLMLDGYIDMPGMLSGGMMERNAYLRVGIMASSYSTIIILLCIQFYKYVQSWHLYLLRQTNVIYIIIWVITEYQK